VRELRNKWAHPTPENEFNRDDSFRLLDSLSRALRQLEIGDAELFDDLDDLKAGLLTVVTVVERPTPVFAPVEAMAPQQLVPERLAFPNAAAAVAISVALIFGAVAVVILKNNGNTVPEPQRSTLPSAMPSHPKDVQPPAGVKPIFNPSMKKPETSEEAREKGMKLYREGEAYFRKSGDLHARDVIFKKSIEHFERSARLDSRNPEPLFNNAVVLEAMNRRAEARNLFKKVVALSGQRASFIKSKSQSSIARIDRQLGPSNKSRPSAKQ
jgi:tetratricopeptide (TPR) repeat protein